MTPPTDATTTRDDVQAALDRAKRDRTGVMDWSVDARRSQLIYAFAMAFDDRACLAAEIDRLHAELARCEGALAAAKHVIDGKDSLLVAYRVGKRPSETTWQKLEKWEPKYRALVADTTPADADERERGE